MDDASFLVCYYLTVYISGMPPFTPGDGCSHCPTGYLNCDSNGLCATSSLPPLVPDDSQPPTTIVRRVTGRSPTVGSLGGGTRMSIRGEGFSSNQHSGANEVYLQSGDSFIPCDVQAYYSTSTQIVCDTRPSPTGTDSTWFLVIRVRDRPEDEWEDVPCNNCRFFYRYYLTPIIESIEPSAGQPSSLVNVFGRIFTVAFDDTPEDPPADIITRLTVGNRLCNHVDENGELYWAQLTSARRGIVACLTNTTNIIDSMNVSLTLEERGSSFIPLNRYIVGIDNQLRPYSYQTHADILSVSPGRGSLEGGTTITVTTSVDLDNYKEDDVQVSVGG